MKEACAMPVQGGPPVTFCPLLGVILGLPGFGIGGVGTLLKCINKCPGRGGPGQERRGSAC